MIRRPTVRLMSMDRLMGRSRITESSWGMGRRLGHRRSSRIKWRQLRIREMHRAEAAPQAAPRVVAAEPPAPEDAVTIVFKDGRAPLQIHNYALTPTMLYVTDARHRDIPLADIDLAATDKANREAGVSFTVPVTR